ncbi:MAG: cbb3-type cytochrome oxidase assembly protein CcoS [Gammaproteobacteria bacterium]|nr:cbb3-type cytochrome oxidase assembly protein CcoS [Gammaproteobacteria bacterium]
MNILLLLIPMALIIIAVAIWFFFWAIKSQQFDDLDRQGANILFDDDQPQRWPAKVTANVATKNSNDTSVNQSVKTNDTDHK